MKTLTWTIATVSTGYLVWLLFRKTGDTPLEAGKRIVRTATSPMPVAHLAGELKDAWADHHTTA